MNGQINIGDVRPLRYFLTIAVVVGLMFTFIAPDDNLKYGWFSHLLHWQLQTILPMLIAITAQRLLLRSPLVSQLNPWLKLCISGVFACLLMSPIALFSDLTLGNQHLSDAIAAELINEFFAITPPILVCWVAINSPFLLGWQLTKVNTESESDTNEVTDQPQFYDLLPKEVHGEIVFLKSELHYLEVVTTKGKALILYTLKNAIQELHQYDGVQPHRSYWVNQQFIRTIEKLGREGRIQTCNGDFIPVSRSNMKKLRL